MASIAEMMEAAMHDHLLDDFDQWGLRDGQGQTVAHEATKYGTLPKDVVVPNLG